MSNGFNIFAGLDGEVSPEDTQPLPNVFDGLDNVETIEGSGKTNLRLASEYRDPTKEAKALKDAKQTDMPIDFVRSNPNYNKLDIFNDYDAATPAVKRYLGNDIVNAGISQNDINQLSTIDRLLTEDIPVTGSIRSIAVGLGSGILELPKAIGEAGELVTETIRQATPMGTTFEEAEQTEKFIQSVEQDIPTLGSMSRDAQEYLRSKVGDTKFEQLISQASESIGTMLALLVTGGQSSVLTGMSAVAGIGKTAEARREGATFGKAFTAGAFAFAVEYLTEKIPLDTLRAPGLSFFKRLSAGIVTDVPGELASTALDMKIIDEGILGKEPLTIEQYKQALIDTFFVSLLMTTGTTTPVHILQSSINHIDESNRKSVQENAARDNASVEIDNSETKQLSDPQMEIAISEIDGDAGIYITNDGVERLFFQEDTEQINAILRKVDLDPDKVRKQAEQGQDILVKQAKVLGLLSAEERAIIMPYIKKEITSYSPQQITDQLPQEEAEQLKETYSDILQDTLEFDTELDRIRGELITAGIESGQARDNVELVSRFANGLALQGQDRTAFLNSISVKPDRKRFFRRGRPARGATSFITDEQGNESAVITLFKDADASTIPHEFFHTFIEQMERVENLEGVTDQFKADMQSLRDWSGIEKGSKELSDDQKEQLAKGWEQFLREGKAPNDELRGVFVRFKTWLTEIYKRARNLNVELTKEVRDVFNRMLDSETETKTVAAINNMVEPTKARMNELGIPDDEQFRLKALVNRAIEKSDNNLFRDRNNAVRKNKKQFRIDAEQEARADDVKGVYSTIDTMKADNIKLNRQEFVEKYGKDAERSLPAKNLLVNDGVFLDEAAVLIFDFDSADDMMTAFFNTLPLNENIDARVDKKVTALEDTFRAEDYLAESPDYAEYINRMNKHLQAAESREVRATVTGKPRKAITTEQLKAFAESEMLDLSVREAQRTDKFLSAMKRAAIAMAKAERSKDWARAIRENEKMALNKEMATIANRIKKDVQAFVKRAGKYSKLGKPESVSLRFREGIRSLIGRFGVLPNVTSQKTITTSDLLKLFKGDDFVGEFMALPFLTNDKNLERPRDYRAMPMIEWRHLNHSIQYLDKQGRHEQAGKLSDGETLLLDVGNESLAEMDAQKKSKLVLDRYNPIRKALKQSDKFFARMLNLSYITKALGGYKSLREGVKSTIEKHVVERAKDLRDAQLSRQRAEREKIKPHRDLLVNAQRRMIKEHGRKLFVSDNNVPVPTLLQNNGEQLNYWTPEQVISMAFNRGNDSNTSALINGFPGLTLGNVDTLLNKYMTQQEMDAVQSIIDVINSLAPETDAVHTRLRGYHMDMVKARSWEFKGKTYRGGYFPLAIDRQLATVANDFFATKKEEGDFFESEDSRFSVPYAVATHTLTRTDGHTYPVNLRLSVIDHGLDKSIRYITMAEGIRDIDRIVTFSEKVKDDFGNVIGTRGFKQSAVRLMGEDVYSQIRPALKHFVNPRLSGVDIPGNGFVRFLRSIAVPAHIALRPITGIKQLGSIVSAIGEMGLGGGGGLKAYVKGGMYVATNPQASYNTMLDKSAFMKERLKSWERDFLKSRFDSMTPAQREVSFGDRHITWKDVRDFGFITVRIPDTIAVTPVWWGAYLDKLNETGTNEKEAVRYADNIIEDTQPTAQPLDLSAWFREGGFWSLFNLHQTFTVGNYGQRQRTWFRAWRKGEVSTMQYARFNFMDAIIPHSIMVILVSFLRGGDIADEEEQKEIAEDILVNWAFMGLPMATSLYNSITEGWSSPLEVAGAQEIERWISTVRLLARGFDEMDDKQQERALWGLADMTSDILRVPVSRVAKDMIQGETLQEKIFKPKKKK
jgi:hypothetical protein